MTLPDPRFAPAPWTVTEEVPLMGATVVCKVVGRRGLVTVGALADERPTTGLRVRLADGRLMDAYYVRDDEAVFGGYLKLCEVGDGQS